MFEDLCNIKNNEVDNFIQRIDSLNYKRNSVKKVLRLTLEFFRFSRIEHGLNIEIPLLYYPKSLILRNEIDLISTIAHEADHIVSFIFKRVGIKLDLDNDEPHAYLLGYIVEQIYKIYINTLKK